MFDIGFSELLLIAVVALIVLGPEKLPKAARLAGLWVRRAKASWYSVKSELERELAAEELQRSLRDTQAAIGHAAIGAEQLGRQLRDTADAARTALQPTATTAAPAPPDADHADQQPLPVSAAPDNDAAAVAPPTAADPAADTPPKPGSPAAP